MRTLGDLSRSRDNSQPFSENLNRVAEKLFCAVGMDSFFNSLQFFGEMETVLNRQPFGINTATGASSNVLPVVEVCSNVWPSWKFNILASDLHRRCEELG